MSETPKKDTMSKRQIRDTAHYMITKYNADQKEFMMCLEAGICPTCGEPLKTSGLSGEKHVLCICKKGCPLISPKGIDYKALNHDIWKECINNSIRKTATES